MCKFLSKRSAASYSSPSCRKHWHDNEAKTSKQTLVKNKVNLFLVAGIYHSLIFRTGAYTLRVLYSISFCSSIDSQVNNLSCVCPLLRVYVNEECAVIQCASTIESTYYVFYAVATVDFCQLEQRFPQSHWKTAIEFFNQ